MSIMNEKHLITQINDYFTASEESKAAVKQSWRENRFEEELTYSLPHWKIINMSDLNYDYCNIYYMRNANVSDVEIHTYISFIAPVYDIITGTIKNQTHRFHPDQSIIKKFPYQEAITSIKTLMESKGFVFFDKTWNHIRLSGIVTELNNKPTISSCLFQDYTGST